MEIADDDIDPADLAAELDTEPDPALADTDADAEPPEIFTGTARGGPWDGRTVESRRPSGFLLFDRPAGLAWIYDYDDSGVFVARDDTPAALRDGGEFNRWRAVEEQHYDLRVVDSDTAGGMS